MILCTHIINSLTILLIFFSKVFYIFSSIVPHFIRKSCLKNTLIKDVQYSNDLELIIISPVLLNTNEVRVLNDLKLFILESPTYHNFVE